MRRNHQKDSNRCLEIPISTALLLKSYALRARCCSQALRRVNGVAQRYQMSVPVRLPWETWGRIRQKSFYGGFWMWRIGRDGGGQYGSKQWRSQGGPGGARAPGRKGYDLYLRGRQSEDNDIGDSCIIWIPLLFRHKLVDDKLIYNHCIE